MVYIIDGYYEEEADEELILKSKEWSVEQMIDIVGVISLLYREYSKLSPKIPMKILKSVLMQVYGCKDIRHKYEVEKYLPPIIKRMLSKRLLVKYELSEGSVTWLDVRNAADVCSEKSAYVLLQKYVGKERRLKVLEIFAE